MNDGNGVNLGTEGSNGPIAQARKYREHWCNNDRQDTWKT